MAKTPLEQTIKDYFDQNGAILVGMHQDLEAQQALVDKKIKEAMAAVDRTKREVEGELSSALAEYRSTMETQQKWLTEHRSVLVTFSSEMDSRLGRLEERTAAHELREAAFNRRARVIQIAAAIVALSLAIAGVVLWKP